MQSTEDIEAVVTTHRETRRRNDVQAWGALFTEDCDFVGWAGQCWRSRAENIAGHEAVPAAIARQRPSCAIEIAEVAFVAPDVALVHAVWSWEDLVRDAGASREDRRGILTMIMARGTDGFCVRASHRAAVA